MIYFITQGNEFVKIGHTDNPLARVATLQVGNPNELRLWVSFPGGKEEEEIFHKFFKDFHVRGEWFRLNLVVRHFVEHLGELKEFKWDDKEIRVQKKYNEMVNVIPIERES